MPDRRAETLESRIGERLLLYAGMIVVVLGVAFFLRYAFEHDWVSPLVRVLLGAAAGVSFMAGGRALAARGYRQYGLFVSGGGLAIVFLSIYAAHAFYALLPQAPAFLLLAATAAGAAVLADREGSLALALMAVCGGFVTPFLVGGGSDAHVVLFSYDAALLVATLYLAQRRGWPWLHVVSLTMVVVTVALWADRYYSEELYLRVELFLTLFCACFVTGLVQARRSTAPDAHTVSNILWIAPILYHAASVVLLGDREPAFHVYLVLVSLAVVGGSLVAGGAWLRLAGWVAVALPLLLFLGDRSGDGSPAGAVVSGIVWLVFLAPTVRTVLQEKGMARPDVVLVHANGNGVFAAVYVALHALLPAGSLATIALLFSAVNAGLWWWLRAVPAALHWFGVASALAAVAVAVAFEGVWTVVMWAAEAGVMVWVGSRMGIRWLRVAGLLLFVVAVATWFDDPLPSDAASFTVVLNARALSIGFVIAAMYVAAYFTRRETLGDGPHLVERAVLLVGASVVTVLAMSTEIWSYWAIARSGERDAVLAREMMLSAAWAGYAGLLVALGMRYHFPPIRYFAIALFGLTLLKVFAVDVQQLEGIYRVIGFLVVGGVLLLASFLYQRSRKSEGSEGSG
jgi:uncharacterized membrane protein